MEAPHGCVSLYNALIIKDPVVSNCIVDQSSLENILLISNEEKAMELMSDRVSAHSECMDFSINLKFTEQSTKELQAEFNY